MTDQHSITPPLQLIKEWRDEWFESDRVASSEYVHIATKAARWAADQELEACCEWFAQDWSDTETAAALRATRRPKPPSLKEQALEQLECVNGILRNQGIIKTDIIRRALEALPDD